MENEIKIAVENINRGIETLEGLIRYQHIAIVFGLSIFLIGAIICLFLYRKNSAEVLKNILDILKYTAAIIAILSSSFFSEENLHIYFSLIFFIYIILNIGVICIYKLLKRKKSNKN